MIEGDGSFYCLRCSSNQVFQPFTSELYKSLVVKPQDPLLFD